MLEGKYLNPFSNDEEVEMQYIFDTDSLNLTVTGLKDSVNKVILYIMNHQDSSEVQLMMNFLNQRLKPEAMNIINDVIASYMEDTKTFRRYLLYKEERDIYAAFDLYQVIYYNIKILQNIVINENKRKRGI